ncbi:MAG: O-antigen ligase family protein [Clostridia bacterium]|nr:O-antigen ligase family protein [Clostridia bacterium]
MKKTTELVRRTLLALLGNPGIYALAAFTVTGMFTIGALAEYRGVLELNLIIPWGLALCLLQLERRAQRRETPVRLDICVLFVLYVWLVAPFMKRFGPTTNNIASWHNHAIIFFGIYALGSSMEEKRLGHTLDAAFALGAAVTAVFCGALLLAAARGQGSNDPAVFGFGVFMQSHLCSGAHYNTTGMLAMCCSFLCLAGVSRVRNRGTKLVYAVPAVMAMVVTVLSQSRTARYSLLVGLAVGCYGMIASCRFHRRALVRHAAGMLAGAVLLAGGYLAAGSMTRAAIAWYARVQAAHPMQQTMQEVAQPAPQAPEAQDSSANPESGAEAPAAEVESDPTYRDAVGMGKERSAGEGTFTGRTDVWKNIFKMWKAEPKYMLIGNGVGRTSRDILIGTPLEGVGANQAHNTYLQFIMDYGLIGFVLLCVFFALTVPHVLRVFLAAPGEAAAGSRALCMLVVGCLMTGMMESDPLGAMRPSNVMLVYAMACIVGAGRNMKR